MDMNERKISYMEIDDEEILNMILIEDEMENQRNNSNIIDNNIFNNQNNENENKSINKFNENNNTNFVNNRNFVLTQNLEMPSINNNLIVHQNIGGSINFNYKINNYKENIDNKKVSREVNIRKQTSINNMINIIKYISSKKYLYEHLFLSKNYYFFILFSLNKIINNFNNEKVYSDNIIELFLSLSFSKYHIQNYEDFYFNVDILDYLDFSINLIVFPENTSSVDNEKNYLSRKICNQNINKIKKKEFSLFIIKVFEYLFEILNFITKHSIAQIKLDKKIHENENNNNKHKFLFDFEKKLNWLNKLMEKLFKNVFYPKECVDLFQNPNDIIISEISLNDKKNFILRKFAPKKFDLFTKALDHIQKINENLKYFIKNNLIDLEIDSNESYNFTKLDYIKNSEYIDFSIEFFNKFFEKMIGFNKNLKNQIDVLNQNRDKQNNIKKKLYDYDNFMI